VLLPFGGRSSCILRRKTVSFHLLTQKFPPENFADMVAVLGEFVGTTMFLFFAFAGTQVANAPTAQTTGNTSKAASGPNPATLLYISLSFGFSLMANAWVFFRISGGLFNPAVSSPHYPET
jgi:glycerol uptake facilitator-like aquaporin